MTSIRVFGPVVSCEIQIPELLDSEPHKRVLNRSSFFVEAGRVSTSLSSEASFHLDGLLFSATA